MFLTDKLAKLKFLTDKLKKKIHECQIDEI